MEKPQVLYHGSSDRNIEKFIPQQKSFRDIDEGVLVFATSDKALATCFITHIRGMECGKFNNIPYSVLNKEVFTINDKGGALYEIPSDTFESDENKGMGKNEWVSRDIVNPSNKMEFEYSLQAMLEHGVQVYLTDQETLDDIKKSSDHGKAILMNLESENKKQGINIQDLR